MELAPEGSVQQRIDEKGPIPWREATRILADACRGLIAAHEKGLIHRDIKPANLLCFAGGVTKLGDFGLAKALANNALSITDVGTVLGTPHYMSPEQWRGDRLDGRADLYSLGATFYTLLTGETPFRVSEPLQMMYAHCSGELPDPQLLVPSLPAGCVAIVRRAMAKSPADRYTSAEEMLTDLEMLFASPDGQLAGNTMALKAPDTRPLPRFRRRQVGGMILVGAALVALLAYLLFRPGDTPTLPDSKEWRWPENPLATPDEIGSIAFSPSPDEPLLAWGHREKADEGIIKVWDLRTGTIRHRISTQGVAMGLIFSPEGRTLHAASASTPNVRRWDTKTGKELPPLEAADTSGKRLALSPDKRFLAMACEPWSRKPGSRGVLVWDLATGKPIPLPSPPNEACDAVAISPDGKVLVVSAKDGTLPRWDTSTWQPLPALSVKNGHVYCLAFSDDGKYLVGGTGTGEHTLYVWDGKTGEPRDPLRGHTGSIWSVVFAPNRALLASSGTDALRFWDIETGKRYEHSIPNQAGGVMRGLAVSPDGHMILSGGASKQLLRFDLRDSLGDAR
jgi:serine/threonine protein kinase